MSEEFCRKWRWPLVVSIALAVIAGAIFGPVAVKFFGTVFGIYLIIYILLKGSRVPEGSINPWHFPSGRGGGGI